MCLLSYAIQMLVQLCQNGVHRLPGCKLLENHRTCVQSAQHVHGAEQQLL